MLSRARVIPRLQDEGSGGWVLVEVSFGSVVVAEGVGFEERFHETESEAGKLGVFESPFEVGEEVVGAVVFGEVVDTSAEGEVVGRVLGIDAAEGVEDEGFVAGFEVVIEVHEGVAIGRIPLQPLDREVTHHRVANFSNHLSPGARCPRIVVDAVEDQIRGEGPRLHSEDVRKGDQEVGIFLGEDALRDPLEFVRRGNATHPTGLPSPMARFGLVLDSLKKLFEGGGRGRLDRFLFRRGFRLGARWWLKLGQEISQKCRTRGAFGSPCQLFVDRSDYRLLASGDFREPGDIGGPVFTIRGKGIRFRQAGFDEVRDVRFGISALEAEGGAAESVPYRADEAGDGEAGVLAVVGEEADVVFGIVGGFAAVAVGEEAFLMKGFVGVDPAEGARGVFELPLKVRDDTVDAYQL